jgi:hypothetical protein
MSRRIWKVWDLVSAPLSDLENVLQQYVPQYNLSSEPNIIIKSFRKELFDCVICETSSESQKVNFNWKPDLFLNISRMN